MPEEKRFTFVAGGRGRSKLTRMVFIKQSFEEEGDHKDGVHETSFEEEGDHKDGVHETSFEEEGESKQNQTEVILLYQPKCCTASP